LKHNQWRATKAIPVKSVNRRNFIGLDLHVEIIT
jgi:hypothetical protein